MIFDFFACSTGFDFLVLNNEDNTKLTLPVVCRVKIVNCIVKSQYANFGVLKERASFSNFAFLRDVRLEYQKFKDSEQHTYKHLVLFCS